MAEKQKAPPAPVEEMVRCRVTAPHYGVRERKFKGELVEVPRAEVNRLRAAVLDGAGAPTGEFRYPVLLPLEVERTQQKEDREPEQDRRRIEAERAKQQALAKMEAERDRLLQEELASRSKQALEAAAQVLADAAQAATSGDAKE